MAAAVELQITVYIPLKSLHLEEGREREREREVLRIIEGQERR